MVQADVTEQARMLGRCRLFRGLALDDLFSVAKSAEWHSFNANAELCQEGEPSNALWILMSGSVRLMHAHPDGRMQLLALRVPVIPLELSSVVEGRPYLTTIQAVRSVQAVRLPSPVFHSVLKAYPETRSHALEELCAEVRERDIAATTSLMPTARERISCALLRLARQVGVAENGSVRLTQPLTRQDIAAMTGVALETCIRTMAKLQREGVLATNDQLITIQDVPSLRRDSGCTTCLLDCTVYRRSAYTSR